MTTTTISPPLAEIAITDFGQYLTKVEDELFLTGTRIGLWQIVRGYKAGNSPEQIALDFPAASLTQIYAAITYYLANRPFLTSEAEGDETAYDSQALLVQTLRERLAARYEIIQEGPKTRLIPHETPLSTR